ncbi:MAG: hypothetical protein JSW06_05615 [Thermoplasmatales archaeon]|nr:MAG: hypothetical protein JSW06_05615 [Thermoplasmatales archaeon]
MKENIEKFLSSGNGFLLLGILWLLFWIGPAFFLFEEDPRWGHNYAIPILFITVGLAYNLNKNSVQLTALIASYITIPTFLGFWRWDTATIISIAFMIVILILYFVERIRKTELINPNQRLNFWLKKHLMTFAYIGIVHMSLIFFFVRWYNPDPFLEYLPIEHHVSTSIFNGMLFVLTIFAIMERNVKKIGRFSVAKMGFIWSVLMIILPIVAINILGE